METTSINTIISFKIGLVQEASQSQVLAGPPTYPYSTVSLLYTLVPSIVVGPNRLLYPIVTATRSPTASRLQCWCGVTFDLIGEAVNPDERCSSVCEGNSSQICGGDTALSVYSTGL